MPIEMVPTHCTACLEFGKRKIEAGAALPKCHCGGTLETGTQENADAHLLRRGVRRFPERRRSDHHTRSGR